MRTFHTIYHIGTVLAINHIASRKRHGSGGGWQVHILLYDGLWPYKILRRYTFFFFVSFFIHCSEKIMQVLLFFYPPPPSFFTTNRVEWREFNFRARATKNVFISDRTKKQKHMNDRTNIYCRLLSRFGVQKKIAKWVSRFCIVVSWCRRVGHYNGCVEFNSSM